MFDQVVQVPTFNMAHHVYRSDNFQCWDNLLKVSSLRYVEKRQMTKQEIARAIATAPKEVLFRLWEAVENCPKSARALTAKTKKEEAERETTKKKNKRSDLICL